MQSTKTARLETRITEEQKELFAQAAAIAGYKSVNEFIVTSAQAHAMNLIRDYEVMQLSRKGSVAFIEALLDDAGPNDTIRKAANKYMESGWSQ